MKIAALILKYALWFTGVSAAIGGIVKIALLLDDVRDKQEQTFQVSQSTKQQSDSILNILGSDMLTRGEFYSVLETQNDKLDYVIFNKDKSSREIKRGVDSILLLQLEEQMFNKKKVSFGSGVIQPSSQ